MSPEKFTTFGWWLGFTSGVVLGGERTLRELYAAATDAEKLVLDQLRARVARLRDLISGGRRG